MITIPSVLMYKDIAVYPDDKDCNLFYCIRTTPRIRMENGKPVFSGLFYTDKADGKLESTMGLAGAFINFDANLSVDQTEYDEIAQRLKDSGIQKDRVRIMEKKNQERMYFRNRLKDQGGRPIASDDPTGYDIPAIGDIRFGSIDFKEGTVELLEDKAGDIVANSSSGGRCAGFGDNNAAFYLRLTHLGAATWYEALKQKSKAFGIRYNLKFDIRVPCLEMRIYAASHQFSDIDRVVERIWKNVDKGCTDADVERIDCKSITQTMVDESVIRIEITQGSSDIPAKDVDKIRESMLSILQAKIEEIIKSKIQGMTREQMEKSMVEKMTEEINSFSELRFTQESVMEWSIAPQGTIMDFMQGIPEEALKRVVTLVDISGSVVPTRKILVQVDAPWDGENPLVNSVDVVLEYLATGEKQSFPMTKDHKQDIWSFHVKKDKMLVRNDLGTVRYTATVWLKGHEKPYVMPTRETTGNVFINVGKIGYAEVTFIPHPSLSSLTKDNTVTGIVLRTRYRTKEERLADEKDQKAGVTREKKRGIRSDFTIPLTSEGEAGKKYTISLGQPLEEPLLYEVEYHFKNRASIVMPESQYYFSESADSQILTPMPFANSLDIEAVAPGAIKTNKNIVSAAVELKYLDEENDFESVGSIKMTAEDEWETGKCTLVIIDRKKTRYQYRYRLEMKDNFFQSDWMEGNGEAEPILLSAPDMFTVDTGLLGVPGEDYYRGELKVHFELPNVNDLSFKFSSLDNEKGVIRYWNIPQEFAGQELKYSYSFVYRDKKGKEDVISGSGDNRTLIIVKPEVEEVKPETPGTFTVDTGLFGVAGEDYYRAELKVQFEDEARTSLSFRFDKKDNDIIRYASIPQELADADPKFSYYFVYWNMKGKQSLISGNDTGTLLMIVAPEPEPEPEPKPESAQEPAPSPDSDPKPEEEE